MNKIFRASISVILLALLLFTNNPRAFACSCIQPPAPFDALANSDAVFAGRVVAIFDANTGPILGGGDPIRATFQVQTVWKGAAVPTLAVTSARDGAACGFPFERGREYLIYANTRDGVLQTNMCTRSNFLNQALADVATLGAGQSIVAAAPEPPSLMPWLIGACVVGLILGAILFGSSLFMLQKKET